jgi:hypothetical protein
MSTRAITVTKRCPMSDDACAARVTEHVQQLSPCVDAAALVEQSCGRYTRGKHKGKLRGWASVEVVTSGGWKRTGYEEGRVVYPGAILSVRIDDFNGKSLLEVAA